MTFIKEQQQQQWLSRSDNWLMSRSLNTTILWMATSRKQVTNRLHIDVCFGKNLSWDCRFTSVRDFEPNILIKDVNLTIFG